MNQESRRPRVKSESGNHESMNCLSWVSWLPDENTTNYGLRDCGSRKVGHQGITLRSLHPPPPRATAWQETFRVSSRAKSPRDYFAISPKLTRLALRSVGGEPDHPCCSFEDGASRVRTTHIS